MNYLIIVSRYNEDINWLEPVMDNTIIINKGNPLNIYNEIPLENVGRESHSYLWYIINAYENLPDILIFTQADISDHRDKNDSSYLLQMKEQAKQNGKSLPHKTHYTSNLNNNDLWCDPEWNLQKDGTYYLHNNYKNNKRVVFSKWFKKNINKKYPNPINIYTNGLFAVKKELILKHPKIYYEKLIKELSHHLDPSEGHFFERSWFYIFR
jgi:hypothetical protein